MTSAHLFAGPEPYRRYPVAALVATAGPALARVDAGEDPDAALSLLSAGIGLFGPTALHVTNVTSLPRVDTVLPALVRDYPALLVMEADSVPVKLERALKGVAAVTKATATGAGAAAAASAAATALGVAVSSTVLNELLTRSGNDPGHVVGVLAACAAAGISPVTSGHVRALAVAADDVSMPWLLLDKLISARPAGLADMLNGSDPIPTIAFLAKRWMVTALVREGAGPDELEALIGGVTDAAARDAARQARTVEAVSVASILSALATADARAKSGHGAEGLSIAAAAIREHAS